METKPKEFCNCLHYHPVSCISKNGICLICRKPVKDFKK